MKTSTDRILTTHTGSLPRPKPLLDVIIGREKGDAIDLAAFDRTMKDPEFLTEAEKIGIEVAGMAGSEVDRLMKEIYETPADLVADARRMISP